MHPSDEGSAWHAYGLDIALVLKESFVRWLDVSSTRLGSGSWAITAFDDVPSGCDEADPIDRGRMIRLVGPGGSAKTTVGALLAQRPGVTFVDLDAQFLGARMGRCGTTSVVKSSAVAAG